MALMAKRQVQICSCCLLFLFSIDISPNAVVSRFGKSEVSARGGRRTEGDQNDGKFRKEVKNRIFQEVLQEFCHADGSQY